MAASREDVKNWIYAAKKRGATHMIVTCDTYEWEDYPVDVMPGESLTQKFSDNNGPNMTKVMEVYAMHLPLDAQLAERRAWHMEPAP